MLLSRPTPGSEVQSGKCLPRRGLLRLVLCAAAPYAEDFPVECDLHGEDLGVIRSFLRKQRVGQVLAAVLLAVTAAAGEAGGPSRLICIQLPEHPADTGNHVGFHSPVRT